MAIPAGIEGEISQGDDVDVFAVEMKAGETLVAEAIAARAGVEAGRVRDDFLARGARAGRQ